MKLIFAKIHLWLSIPVGMIIAIVCLSGAVLVFENEILEACYPEKYRVEAVGSPQLAPSELIGKVRTQLPDSVQVTGVRMYGDAHHSWKIYVDKGNGCFVNPYTGELTGWDERNVFFSKTVRLHRVLLHSYKYGVDTPWGKWIVGCSTIVFVLILVSGIVIWFPTNRRMWKNRLRIKTHVGSFRFWYDVHVAGGIYAAFFLLAMALTGLTWSFKWYRSGFYTMLGADVSQGGSHRGSRRNDAEKTFDYTQWNKVYAEIGARYADFQTLTIRNNSVSVSTATCGNIFATDQFTFDETNGTIIKTHLYNDASRYSKLKGWV